MEHWQQTWQRTYERHLQATLNRCNIQGASHRTLQRCRFWNCVTCIFQYINYQVHSNQTNTYSEGDDRVCVNLFVLENMFFPHKTEAGIASHHDHLLRASHMSSLSKDIGMTKIQGRKEAPVLSPPYTPFPASRWESSKPIQELRVQDIIRCKKLDSRLSCILSQPELTSLKTCFIKSLRRKLHLKTRVQFKVHLALFSISFMIS